MQTIKKAHFSQKKREVGHPARFPEGTVEINQFAAVGKTEGGD
jgi:hypothetical protein